jgi:hypothetical protein
MTQQRQPVISQELAEQIADYLVSLGFKSPYDNVYGTLESPKATCDYDNGEQPLKYMHTPTYEDGRVIESMRPYETFYQAHEVLDFSMFGPLPKFWTIDVAEVFTARNTKINQAETRAAIVALDTTAGIREYLLADFDQEPHGRKPEKCNMTGLAQRALTLRDQYGKARPAWKVEPTCSARLKLKEGVRVRSEQQAYADVSTILIPYEGVLSEKSVARLAEFFRRADTHTGTAGSGTNWSVEGVNRVHQFVILSGRHSIAD